MQLNIDLYPVWNRLVRDGFIKNLFTDEQGRQLETGLRMGANGPEPYVIDLSTGANIGENTQLVRMDNGIEILFNPLGYLKPRTLPVGAGKQQPIASEAEACRLGCQDAGSPLSIINRQALFQTRFANFEWRAIPNMAPWEARGLFLWVRCISGGSPTVFPHERQVLSLAHLEDFLDMARACKQTATFFNALHGGASANHMHIQGAFCDRPMAVELAQRAKIKAYQFTKNYPAQALVFSVDCEASVLWSVVDVIQRHGFPVNIIYLPSGIYLFVRNPEQEVVPEFPGRAFGTINFAGLFITSEASDLTAVSQLKIAPAFSKMTLDANSVLRILGEI